jgi:hypothetical protein
MGGSNPDWSESNPFIMSLKVQRFKENTGVILKIIDRNLIHHGVLFQTKLIPC